MNKKENVDEYAKRIKREVNSGSFKKLEESAKEEHKEKQGELAEKYKITSLNAASVDVEIRKIGRHIL